MSTLTDVNFKKKGILVNIHTYVVYSFYAFDVTVDAKCREHGKSTELYNVIKLRAIICMYVTS